MTVESSEEDEWSESDVEDSKPQVLSERLRPLEFTVGLPGANVVTVVTLEGSLLSAPRMAEQDVLLAASRNRKALRGELLSETERSVLQPSKTSVAPLARWLE